MRLALFLLFFIFSIFAEAKFDFVLPPGFSKIEVPGSSASWRNDKLSRSYILVTENESPRPMDFTGASHKDLINGITGYRRATLNAFGIQQWVLTDLRSEKIGKANFRLELTGSYENTRKEKVQFFEVQYYIGKKFYQISYIETAKVFSKPLADVRKSLASFRPEGL